MVSERLVVVGGVAAGLSAASPARRVNPHLAILVYERVPDISYSACCLPHYVAGLVSEADSLRVYSAEFFRSRRNIQVFTNHEVTELSVARRLIKAVPTGGGETKEIHYDRLVLATGAEPSRPRIPGLDLKGVFHVNDLESTVSGTVYLDYEGTRP